MSDKCHHHNRLMMIGMLVLSIVTAAHAKTTWETLAPGLSYTRLPYVSQTQWGKVHAFKIKLRYFRLRLAFARDHQREATNVAELAKHHQAVIAINGGFFSPKHQPIGLRLTAGQVKSPIKRTSWWGIFYIRRGRPQLRSQKRFRLARSIDFAIQGGPRLIVNNHIPNLKAGFAERSAIGFNQHNDIIIVATENAAMTTTELAKLMQRPETQDGLACTNALNLDGGHSTQLYANVGKLKLNIVGFSAITDAILVIKK